MCPYSASISHAVLHGVPFIRENFMLASGHAIRVARSVAALALQGEKNKKETKTKKEGLGEMGPLGLNLTLIRESFCESGEGVRLPREWG